MALAPLPARREDTLASVGVWCSLAAVLILNAWARWNLIEVPFERDEGTYSYFGQLILAGEIPFVDFYEPKLPGLYYAYAALIAIFGDSLEGVRTGIIAVNALSLLLVFGLACRLGDRASGCIAAASFALLSISPGAQGFTAQSEHLVCLFALAAFACTLWAIERQRATLFAAAGLIAGLAILVKQSAVFFALFGGLAIASQAGWRHFLARESWRPAALYSVGVVVPYALMCIVWWSLGALGELWFWTVEYAAGYASEVSLAEAREFLASEFFYVVSGHRALWWAAGAGCLLLQVAPIEPAHKRNFTLFAVFSLLTVVPGLRFFRHYWLQALPAVALSIGLGAFALRRLLEARGAGARSAFAVSAMVAIGLGFQAESLLPYYTSQNVDQLSRKSYGISPFPESRVVARYIRENSSPDDTIVVFGSEPQVYFYSRRHAATRHSYFEYLVRPHPLVDQWQREFVREVAESQPKFIVAFMNPVSLMGSREMLEQLHREWFLPTVERHYQPVLIGSTVPGKQGGRFKTRWFSTPDEIGAFQPSGAADVYLYERFERAPKSH